ncbi:uncharacterized protein METZ01_LOCUS345911, partial [marine metagenome]
MKGVTLILLKLMNEYMHKWTPILFFTLLTAQVEKNMTGAFGTVTMDG